MRLVDLDPRWLIRDGQRIGIVFRSPSGAKDWITCFWVPSPTLTETGELVKAAGVVFGNGAPRLVACKYGNAWQRQGDSFETLTITPSIDCSASGNWHGYISNGEIK